MPVFLGASSRRGQAPPLTPPGIRFRTTAVHFDSRHVVPAVNDAATHQTGPSTVPPSIVPAGELNSFCIYINELKATDFQNVRAFSRYIGILCPLLTSACP